MKSKAVPLQAMKALLLILDLSITWGEWSVSRTSRALHPRKWAPVPIVQEAGWAPEPVWTQRLEETFFASARDRTQIVQSDYIDWATPAPVEYDRKDTCVCVSTYV
jgi:hypothetical protein